MSRRAKLSIVAETDGLPEVEDFANCLRCNRKLKNPKYRRVGYGPDCLESARYERVMAEAGREVAPRKKRAPRPRIAHEQTSLL
jgi:hypothetical protein